MNETILINKDTKILDLALTVRAKPGPVQFTWLKGRTFVSTATVNTPSPALTYRGANPIFEINKLADRELVTGVYQIIAKTDHGAVQITTVVIDTCKLC